MTDETRLAIRQAIDARQNFFEGLAQRHESLRVNAHEDGATDTFLALVDAFGALAEFGLRDVRLAMNICRALSENEPY